MNKTKNLKVGISLFPPLVMKKGKKYIGFEIELWEEIAQSLSLNFEYKELKFKSLIPSISNNKIDIAFAGITRTEEREKIVDFSHFSLNSGLLILLSSQSKINISTFIKTIIGKSYKKTFYLAFLIFLTVFAFANVIWLLELGSGVFSSSYLNGVGEGIWWIIGTISTVGYGDFAPKTALGRLFGILVIIIGISLFGLLVAKLSSLFTLKGMQYQIKSYRDLSGKKVATKAHTTAQDELINIGAKVTTVHKIEQAYELLEKNKVEAVVFDAPAIKHFLYTQKDQKFISVGDVFSPQTYGFAFQNNSPIKESVNREILKLMESGKYDMLYKKWFGEI